MTGRESRSERISAKTRLSEHSPGASGSLLRTERIRDTDYGEASGAFDGEETI